MKRGPCVTSLPNIVYIIDLSGLRTYLKLAGRLGPASTPYRSLQDQYTLRIVYHSVLNYARKVFVPRQVFRCVIPRRTPPRRASPQQNCAALILLGD